MTEVGDDAGDDDARRGSGNRDLAAEQSLAQARRPRRSVEMSGESATTDVQAPGPSHPLTIDLVPAAVLQPPGMSKVAGGTYGMSAVAGGT